MVLNSGWKLKRKNMKNPIIKFIDSRIKKSLENSIDSYLLKLEIKKRELESDKFWQQRDDDNVRAIIENIKTNKKYELYWIGSTMRPDNKINSKDYIVEKVTKYFSGYAPAFFNVGTNYNSVVFSITDELFEFLKNQTQKQNKNES